MKVRLGAVKNAQPRREHGDIAGLKASIRDVGLIHPPTVDENLNLLAGRRRYQAILELYGPNYEVEVTVLPVNGDRLNAFKIAIDENLKRKPLTDPEVAAAIKKYDGMKRAIEGQAQGGTRTDLGHSVTEVEGWSYQKTADDLSVSKPAVVKAIQIAKAIEEHPDLAGLGSGQAILAEFLKRELIPPPLPAGQYRTIVADPPWPMDKILSESLYPHDPTGPTVLDKRPDKISPDYATMSLEEIKAFPVPSLAYPNGSHLYLWTTQRFLPDAFECLKIWGCRYSFTMVWHKSGGFQPLGLPQYNCEFVLFARYGSLPFLTTKGFFTCFSAPRREPSRKPDEFYDLVRRVSPGPRLDLFSREARVGFESWGNEMARFQAPQRNDHQCGATAEPCG